MSWAELFSKDATGSWVWSDPLDETPKTDKPAEPVTYDYEGWLAENFGHVASKSLAPRHHRLWKWFDLIRKGEPPPPPRVEGWPRGGAKSTTAELGVTYVGVKMARRFVLYVSGTQDQADKHVQSIANLFERIGVERSLGKYGHSRGWRRNQLRTSLGFNVEAIGLDVAARGVKLDEFRPDLIIFDDLDGQEDTPATTAKKIRAITKALIPAGSDDCAVLFIQNLIIEDGIMSQLVDGRADFLMGRQCFVEPAVHGLETTTVQAEDGSNKYQIVAGQPTWDGQNLVVCERQINDWGLRAFLQEAQHQVQGSQGYFFDETKLLEFVDEAPALTKVVRAWDFAATQGGGDYTAGVLMGLSPNGRVWVLDVVRGQFSIDNVERLVGMVADWDRSVWGKKYTLRTPEDPGSAGKRAAALDKRLFDAKTEKVTGKKWTRAKKFAEKVNSDNCRLVKDGRSRTPEIDEFLDRVTRRTALEGKTLFWNRDFTTELRKFRADESHEYDDQVDAASDAFNEMCPTGGWAQDPDFLTKILESQSTDETAVRHAQAS